MQMIIHSSIETNLLSGSHTPRNVAQLAGGTKSLFRMMLQVLLSPSVHLSRLWLSPPVRTYR